MTPAPESRISFGRILWFAGFLLLILAALLGTKSDVTMTGVESSRMAMLQALTDQGTFCIDQSFFRTLDQGIIDGRRFSDKPPLLSLAGAGVYALLKCCGISFETHYSLTVYLVTLLLMLPVNILIVLTAWRFLKITLPDAPEPYRIAGAFLTVFSTLVWSYSVTFNNHTPAALMILLMALVLAEPGYSPGKRALLAGICAAVLGNLEYVLGGAFGLAGAAYFAWKRDWRSCGIFCAAGMGGVLLAGILNYCNHGSFLPLYLATHKPAVVGKNLLLYAWQILLGCKGLFLFTPALLWVFLCGGKEERDPAKHFLLGAMALTVVLYCFGSSDLGGWCYGFRFFLPLAPLGLLYVWRKYGTWQRRWDFGLLMLAILWGAAVAELGTYNPWCASYEGTSTRGDLNFKVRSPILANAMTRSFERDPDGALCRFLIEDVYGEKVAYPYLFQAFQNMKNTEMMRAILEVQQ